MKQILVARHLPDAVLPTRKHPTDAGLDLYCYYNTILTRHTSAVISTGVQILIPEGYVGLIKAKGKNPWIVSAGVIDAGYTGEIMVKIVNALDRTLSVAYGQSLAQLLIIPIETPKIGIVTTRFLTLKGAEISERDISGGINV